VVLRPFAGRAERGVAGRETSYVERDDRGGIGRGEREVDALGGLAGDEREARRGVPADGGPSGVGLDVAADDRRHRPVERVAARSRTRGQRWSIVPPSCLTSAWWTASMLLPEASATNAP